MFNLLSFTHVFDWPHRRVKRQEKDLRSGRERYTTIDGKVWRSGWVDSNLQRWIDLLFPTFLMSSYLNMCATCSTHIPIYGPVRRTQSLLPEDREHLNFFSLRETRSLKLLCASAFQISVCLRRVWHFKSWIAKLREQPDIVYSQTAWQEKTALLLIL